MAAVTQVRRYLGAMRRLLLIAAVALAVTSGAVVALRDEGSKPAHPAIPPAPDYVVYTVETG